VNDLIPSPVKLRVLLALHDQALDPCSRAVLWRLREAAGRAQAVSIAAMQSGWASAGNKVYTDREVKAAVKLLLEERGVPIGSSRSGLHGYYLLVTPEDIDHAQRPLVGEIRSLARRLRAIDPKSEISRALCGQLGIE
jgi:hypothetical protein